MKSISQVSPCGTGGITEILMSLGKMLIMLGLGNLVQVLEQTSLKWIIYCVFTQCFVSKHYKR